MRKIIHNPYLAFPLGTALAMALVAGWSLVQSDRLVINEAFLVFLLLLPLLAAGYSLIVGTRASWFRRILTWVGTSALGIIAAFSVFLTSSAVFAYTSVPVYNYAHFDYSDYGMRRAERRMSAGGKALDGTLYTLEGNEVRLSDLWKERPIVVEFGSVT